MIILCQLLFVLGLALVSNILAQLVNTPDGPIKGIQKISSSNKTYNSYLTIPYAKPPIGDRRFLASERADPWNETYDGSIGKNKICFQLPASTNIGSQTEDCLYLSVYTPENSEKLSQNFPVLVNIHGGSFTGGSGVGSPPTYLVDEGVIVVYLNYRLGVFGFLSTGDSVIPGNAGLSDQILALKWVKRNIAAFGGDPDRITVSGQSAGAKSVGYLISSPLASGLFSAAIMESGTALCVGGYQTNHTEIAFRIGSFIDSSFENSTDSKKLLTTLQAANATTLNQAASNYTPWARKQPNFFERLPFVQGYYLTPALDADNQCPVLPRLIYESLVRGKIHKVPILMGVCSEEGLMDQTFKDKTYLEAFDKNPTYLNPQDMHIQGETAWTEVGNLIKNQYSPSNSFLNNPLGILQYYTDQEYIRGSTKHAELHSKYADVFYYQFSFTGQLDGGNTGYPGSGNVSHVSETPYIYGRNSLQGLPESDQLISRRLVKIWTNFLKYRNPTPIADALLQNITWPKVTPDNFYHVNVGNYENTDLVIKKGKPKPDRMAFWDNVYNTYGNRPFNTY